jgi:hypothetical protein
MMNDESRTSALNPISWQRDVATLRSSWIDRAREDRLVELRDIIAITANLAARRSAAIGSRIGSQTRLTRPRRYTITYAR